MRGYWVGPQHCLEVRQSTGTALGHRYSRRQIADLTAAVTSRGYLPTMGAALKRAETQAKSTLKHVDDVTDRIGTHADLCAGINNITPGCRIDGYTIAFSSHT